MKMWKVGSLESKFQDTQSYRETLSGGEIELISRSLFSRLLRIISNQQIPTVIQLCLQQMKIFNLLLS